MAHNRTKKVDRITRWTEDERDDTNRALKIIGKSFQALVSETVMARVRRILRQDAKR